MYACGFKSYLDDRPTTYYVEHSEDSDTIVLKLINELLRSKYSKTTFYCHNLGGFDIVFVLKILVDYNQFHKDNQYDLSFKFRDNKILSIIIKKGGNRLEIKDSYPIFTSSLRSLAQNYDCTHHKGYFPYKFSTTPNLFYEGPTPSLEYYTDISNQDYKAMQSDN